jgi:site-specific DNA-methyltransferase (adenine-specific)
MKYNPQGLISCEIKKTNANKRKDGWYLGERENFSDGEYKQEFKNYPSTILKYKRDRGLHPTQKPVEMFEYLIRTYTEPGAVVLDNCIGSGTTAVSCIRSGRNFIGFENDTEHGYYETAMQRIKAVWHENRSH